ncbi:acetyl-CoA carboxylase biotin carboxyl carrier protein [Chondrinema litorale]|uniref:acetyl-CoA carboxylase biotin carboxyl carrier protein n=1 Tax=Chondrinema litorale TaxID=2994555 RepID=UPI0025432260|nr:acetyl-CoA carboxylase biotin carboxyl carrier protein [Chondrinema litorale]UZR93742.1 acetyl-CoA carboxylase biotin carboxyl carrier protein [Chondrinema litorale]
MKAKEIKELINFIANSGLDEVNIETDEIKLHVKKQSEAVAKLVEQTHQPQVIQQPVSIPQQITTSPSTESAAPVKEDNTSTETNYITIKSPMIGTFYRSSSPESDAFVNVGDNVSNGSVVCIIEAMKLFNEIESEVSGKIVKVLVENASPVEYDQPLFLVDPS